MKSNKDTLDLIEGFESLRLQTYKDSKGVLTIGYGHTGTDVVEGMIITKDQADAFLVKDIQTAENAVNTLVKVPITQEQYNALVSFVFNVGRGNFVSSSLLKLLNQHDYEGAAEQFPRWDKSGGVVIPGLLNRRLKEQSVFNS